MSDKQLYWIKETRRPRDPEKSIGQIIERSSSYKQVVGSAQLDALRADLEEVMGPVFKQHCEVLGVSKSVLTIGVNDPGLVYSMKRDFLFALKDHLAAAHPQLRIFDIQFKAVCR